MFQRFLTLISCGFILCHRFSDRFSIHLCLFQRQRDRVVESDMAIFQDFASQMTASASAEPGQREEPGNSNQVCHMRSRDKTNFTCCHQGHTSAGGWESEAEPLLNPGHPICHANYCPPQAWFLITCFFNSYFKPNVQSSLISHLLQHCIPTKSNWTSCQHSKLWCVQY